MNIIFSIIMPVYNAEAYLDKSVSSVLGQSFTEFELIMVDDGSKDSSPQMCDEYKKMDSRINVIHQANGGQTRARKAAAKAARGQYIVCVDSDDWIHQDYLLLIKRIIDKTSADVICCGMMRVIGDEEISMPVSCRKGIYDKINIEQEIYPILIHPADGEGFTPAVWGKAIRSNFYKLYQERVDSSLRMAEDLTCSLPCVYASEKIYVMEECLYYYRDNPTSFTKGCPVLDWNGPELIASNLSMSIDMKSYDFEEQMNRRVLRELFLVATSQFNRVENYKIIKHDIKKQLKRTVYKNAIKHAHFSFGLRKTNLRYCFYSLSLKCGLIRLIKLYNSFLNRR